MKDGVKVKKILRNEFNTKATSARCTFNIVDFKFWIYICTDHIVDADTRAAAEKRFIEEVEQRSLPTDRHPFPIDR